MYLSELNILKVVIIQLRKFSFNLISLFRQCENTKMSKC